MLRRRAAWGAALFGRGRFDEDDDSVVAVDCGRHRGMIVGMHHRDSPPRLQSRCPDGHVHSCEVAAERRIGLFYALDRAEVPLEREGAEPTFG